MTNADMIQINAMLEGMRKLTNAADAANRKYYDERIDRYARDAITNYKANKATIARIVEENINCFFTNGLIEVADNVSNERLYASRGEPFCRDIGNGVHVVLRLTDFTRTKGDEWKTTFFVKSLEAQNVYFRTSDTSTAEYGICSAWDLVDVSNRLDLVSHERTATEWKDFYNRANATRAKNDLLVRKFKECLAARTDILRARTDALEETRKSADTLNTEYTNINI
jgi:hypothetical protein